LRDASDGKEQNVVYDDAISLRDDAVGEFVEQDREKHCTYPEQASENCVDSKMGISDNDKKNEKSKGPMKKDADSQEATYLERVPWPLWRRGLRNL